MFARAKIVLLVAPAPQGSGSAGGCLSHSPSPALGQGEGLKVPYEDRKKLYADPGISDTAKTLFTVLAGFTKGGLTDCDLTNRDLATASGNSPRTVERPLAELRALGWIAYAESRAGARIIALTPPQNSGQMPAKVRETARKSAGSLNKQPVKNLILTSEVPVPPSNCDGEHIRAREHCWKSATRILEHKPSWTSADWTQFARLFTAHHRTADEVITAWNHYAASTEPFTVKQALSMRYFASNFDKFFGGPVNGNQPKHFDLQADEVTNATLRKHYSPTVARPALQDLPGTHDGSNAQGLPGSPGRLLPSGSGGGREGSHKGVRPDADASTDPKGVARSESLAEEFKRLEALRTMR